MKKPYIKRFSRISKFSVWIVDGEYIRKNINEEFTNYGQHYQFNFIPENEFWIDQERVSGEEKFYIDSMLTTNRLMSGGVSHKKAVKIADKIEKRERAKSKLMKKETKLEKHKKAVIDSIHKKLLKEYSTDKIKIWIVNGEAVRDLFFLDFTEGGHDKVYSFIPKGEIWIDDDTNSKEIKFVLLHELHERRLMSKGIKYDFAHHKSSNIEYFCRYYPKKLDAKLKEEIKANNK